MGIQFPMYHELHGREPDYAAALMKGMKVGYEPARQSEELLGYMLQSKIDESKAKYADRMAEANLAHLSAGTQGLNDAHGMSGLQRQLLQQKLKQGQFEQDLNDRITQGMSANNSSYGSEDKSSVPSVHPMPKPTLNDNIMDGMGSQPNSNTQSKGNPALYHIDDMVDSDPAVAAHLKTKFGYEKKVTPKFDPKTGITSIVTQYPSGRIDVETSGEGKQQLTNTVKTNAQNAVESIPKVLKIIDQLKEKPSPVRPPTWLGALYRGSARAEHNALVNEGKDLYLKALSLKSSDKGLETAEEILGRGESESDSNYRKRLDGVRKRLLEHEKEAKKILGSGGVSLENNNSTDLVIEYARDQNGRLVPSK